MQLVFIAIGREENFIRQFNSQIFGEIIIKIYWVSLKLYFSYLQNLSVQYWFNAYFSFTFLEGNLFYQNL